jgi:hypothetical protein
VVDLTYCMNVHPGEHWEDQVRATREDVRSVRESLGCDQPFGLGLRISARAAAELTATPSRVADYRALLDASALYAFTVNAFPFGTFHGARVKDEVYQPDWRSHDRVTYTLQVADILAQLLPEGRYGSISTAPLTFKGWPEWQMVQVEALTQVAEVAFGLHQLAQRTGRTIVLAMEPEPGCYPETTPELIAVMQALWEHGTAYLARTHGVGLSEAEQLLHRHVGCCFDTAHQAVEFEDLVTSLAALRAADVRVAKVQVSAAIEVDCSEPDAVAQLAAMQDEVYLHQVCLSCTDGSLHHWYDLPACLQALPGLPGGTARVHYHVPLFVDRFGSLRSTAYLLEAAARALLSASDHIEAETYTWQVWKEATGESLPLHKGIARELSWLNDLVHRAGVDA